MTASSAVSPVATTTSSRPAQPVFLLRSAQLLLGLLALSSGSAMAATFCVGTGNELATALQTAANNTQNDEIRIRIGTLTRSGAAGTVPRWEYDLGAGTGDHSNTLTMSGGWTDCNTQMADPRLTVLDAQYQGTAVYLQLYTSQTTISVSNLTITRAQNNGDLSGRPGASLSVNAPYSSSTILLDRLIVVAGKSLVDSGAPAGIKLSGFGDGFGAKPTFSLRNSVVAYNAAITVGGVSVLVSDSVVQLNNNSIFSNTATSSSNCRCTGLDLTNDTTSYLSNNVVVDNVDGSNRPSDVRNYVGNAYLRNNHIGHLLATVPPVINLAMTTGAPGWTFSGIYPIPNLNSPLRDTGTNGPAGGIDTIDLAGSARIVNGMVDRGAIEGEGLAIDLIFGDTFQ